MVKIEKFSIIWLLIWTDLFCVMEFYGTNNLLDSMILTLSWPFPWFIINFYNLLGHILSFYLLIYLVFCTIMYYYVLLCIIMYYYVLLCAFLCFSIFFGGFMYAFQCSSELFCVIMYYYVLLCMLLSALMLFYKKSEKH